MGGAAAVVLLLAGESHLLPGDIRFARPDGDSPRLVDQPTLRDPLRGLVAHSDGEETSW